MARAPKPSIRAFVHEYVWGEHAGNGTESARVAGLCKGKRKSQAEYACRLLRRANVRQLVDAQLAEKETLLKQKAVRVAEETFRLAVADIGELYEAGGKFKPVDKMPEHVRRAVASIETEVSEARGVVVKVKLHDKKGAQELFLKYSGKLKDNVKVELDGVTLDQLVPRRAAEPAKE